MTASQDAPHTVYWMYDAHGVLLYVGCTSDIDRRLGQHRRGRPWFSEVERIEVEHFDSRRPALDREREQINSRRPKHHPTYKERARQRWALRRQRQNDAHARGEPCPEWSCRQCHKDFGPAVERWRRERAKAAAEWKAAHA